ncbi:hypothetical protein E4U17_000334 [Claviceps sp. LM77 group G4]|nr:hypothetical protein E4U17_000334 [Claviceps sp. LM77 group G4]KAG6070034.1 hypothetical protein E4U33_004427 [Claviceps sp. LM78 group G4]KAG6081495.1 hypothetical protein E4U16_007331 [Claviceps sp. LM84 group G4]
MAPVISPPLPARLLAPILPALPAAAASPQPAPQILPLLSPILRQRVQLLSGPGSSSGPEPWLRLLCYDAAKAVRLANLVSGPALEPHPVSGEVEIDWDCDAETRYRRLDQETLQALVVLSEVGLAFQLVYCLHDEEGIDGANGWRIGEVTTVETSSPFTQFGGTATIAEAERLYEECGSGRKDASSSRGVNDGGVLQRVVQEGGKASDSNSNKNNDTKDGNNGGGTGHVSRDENEDDDYWDLYDKTPAQTPTGKHRSPAPVQAQEGTPSAAAAEDAYFAQYADVQPAMDNHDPDEEAQAQQLLNVNVAGSVAARATTERERPTLQQPHPDSPTASPAANTIAHLEQCAGNQTRNEFSVKQHISRTIRSLAMLATASGIDTEEFSSLVKTELELLSMAEE